MTPSCATSSPSRLSLPLSEWPERDRYLWKIGFAPVDLVTEESIAAQWGPAQRKMTEFGYGSWLAWLHRRHLLFPEDRPGDRLTLSRVHEYVAELTARVAAQSVVTMASALSATMRAIEPDQDWAWLKAIVAKLRAWAASIEPKQRQTVPIRDLLNLGFDLMEQSAGASISQRGRAALFRDGLMLALLSQRPLRRANLCQIRCGQHLICVDGEFWLVFSAEQTKTGRPIEFTWPKNLKSQLMEYLEIHRLKLFSLRATTASDSADALWINQVGRPLSPASAFERICEHTRSRFGFAVNPHHFRACVATDIAANDPNHVYVAASLLSHGSLATTHKHYIRATALEAGRKHAGAMTELRRSLTEIKRSRN